MSAQTLEMRLLGLGTVLRPERKYASVYGHTTAAMNDASTSSLPLPYIPLPPCLRKVTVTKGLLLGYSPGSTTLRAYADAPRLADSWKPNRERRSSGLACMKGQASRGVWQPIREAAIPALQAYDLKFDGARDVSSSAGAGARNHPNSVGGGGGNARGRYDGTFRLAAEPAAAAAAAGDELSDSESEDDEDDMARPTPDDARVVFSVAAEAAEEAPSSPRSETAAGEVPPGGSGGTGGPGGPGGGVSGGRDRPGAGRDRKIGRGGEFPRDHATAAFESARREKRERDAEVLADRMSAIGAEVRGAREGSTTVDFVLRPPWALLGPQAVPFWGGKLLVF